MKKVFPLFVLMVSGVLFLSACAAQVQAVTLDPGLADWIGVAATVLVGFLLVKAAEVPFVKSLLEYFHIEQHKLAISAWLAGVAVQFIQAEVLDKIPEMWDNVVVIVMQLIVAVIVTLYAFRRLADRGVQGFR